MITNARYANADATLIVADVDEVVRRIISEADTPELWEEALAGEVAPFVPFSMGLPNLEPDQFWFIVRASGYEPELLAWVAAMNDPVSLTYNPVEWAQASAKLEFAKFFERDHPFVEAAREAIGLDSAELGALWAFGAA